MELRLAILFLFSIIPLSIQDGSLYTVVTESQLRSNSKFRFHVTVYSGIEPVLVQVKLISKSDQAVLVTLNTTFGNPPVGLLQEIDIPQLPSDGSLYLLQVIGEGGANFTHEEVLKAQKANKYHVEVTVDKDIYNVGDVVKFNALIVDNRMQAVPDGELANATVYDEYNVVIKEWINIPTKRGFIWGEVYLNDKCHRGEHRIQVNYEKAPGVCKFYVPDETSTQLFFDVEFKMPISIENIGSDTIVTGLVNANYKHGKPVYGTLDLEIKNNNLLQCIFSPYCKRNKNIRNIKLFGSKNFTLNVTEFGSDVDQFTIKAVVTDELTGRVRSITRKLHLNEYQQSKITIKANHAFFVPEMPFSFHIIDSRDKELIDRNDNIAQITLTVSYYLDKEANVSTFYREEKFNYTVSPNDQIFVNVTPPKFTYRTILLLKEDNVILKRLSLKKSPYLIKDHEMTIIVKDAWIGVGSNVSVDVYTSGDINYLSYDIISFRSNAITQSGNLKVSGRGPHKIQFLVTDDSVRYLYLIVYGVTNDGHLVTDQRLYNTQEIHPFEMSLTVDPLDPYPGSIVNMTIESKPNTFVFLKAADSVISQWQNKNYLSNLWDKEWNNKVELSKLLWKETLFSISSALGYYFSQNQLFQHLSLKLHTNARLDIYHPEDPSYRTPPANAGDELNQPRADFSTLWLWRNYTLGEDGKVTITTKVPDRISVWETLLYGVDSQHGLSVLRGPKITVTKPLFAFIDAPPTLVRGEASIVRVIIFQNTPSTVNVTISSENQRFQILDEKSHRVLSNNNLTKEIPARDDEFGFSTSFLISPLYAVPSVIRVCVTNEEGDEDTVIQKITVQQPTNKLQPVIYDAKDASRFGEKSCNQPSVKVRRNGTDLLYRHFNEKLNISFQVNSMNDEEGNLRVNACIKYVHKEETDVVLEISLPSGYEFPSPLLDDTNSTQLSDDYVIMNSNTRLRWYFKKIPDHLMCISVKAKRIFIVYNLQPARVTAYTSFDLQSAKRARVYYQAPSFETI